MSFIEKNTDTHQVALDESFNQIETPEGFKFIELYPHQKTIVSAMLEVEDKRVITMGNRMGYGKISKHNPKIDTSAIVLSEPFGSGKTFEILALILARPVPKAYPTQLNSVLSYSNDTFVHEIHQRFIGTNALIRPNLIIVGSSVLEQWKNAITTHTNLKVFIIGNYHHLKEFIHLYNDNKISSYDIVLLKNGKVTGKLDLPTNKSYHSLINVINMVTEQKCWSRVIYDDFDTIDIPASTVAVNALFTIYISATTRLNKHPNTKKQTYKNVLDMIKKRGIHLSLITGDKRLFTNFNIRNTPEYVERSTRLTKIESFRYVYSNPDDNYMRLLGAMGDVEANNLMEMLNGDAISTAAEAMGIKTTSVADIFNKMLDTKYNRYINDQNVIECIEKAIKTLNGLGPHENNKQHSHTKLEKFRSKLIKREIPNFKFYSKDADRMLANLNAEFEVSKEQNGVAIQRAIDNIKEGDCQVCHIPLGEFDTFIVKCCGLILCDECGIKGNQIGKRYDYKIRDYTVCGSCANCKSVIYPQQDLIFLDRDFDLESLLNAKGDEKPLEAIEESKDETEEESEEKIRNPKLNALFAICNNETPEDQEVIQNNIKHLMLGKLDIPQSNDIERKVLVFAGFNETLGIVEEFLYEQNVQYMRLKGTYREKAQTIESFKTRATVLLINSQQHCAGLNIQYATDLVFFHKLMDPNIESQVTGRIQRIGRTCNARIHHLCYKNEKEYI